MATVSLFGTEMLTYSSLLQLVAQRMGKRPQTVPIPKSAAKLAIWIASGFSTSAATKSTVLDTVFDEHVVSTDESGNPLPFPLEMINEMLDHMFPSEHTI
jgi:hypothetical protein